MRRLPASALTLAVLGILISVTANLMNEETNVNLYMLPDDCDFSQVQANSSTEFDCSPKLADRFFSEFRGLLINAPTAVVWPLNPPEVDVVTFPDGSNNGPYRINVAGLANVPDSTLDLGGDVAYQVLLVAINQQTAHSYSGKMVEMGTPSIPPPGVLPGFEAQANPPPQDQARTSYFNLDLVANLGVPIESATYTVYATLGEFKSNVLSVQITME